MKIDIEQMTLGRAIKELEAMSLDKEIYLDFGGFVPSGHLSSYRGYYEDLAIEYLKGDFHPGANQFLDWLREANGKVFEGYKGGNYKMDENTPLWVENYGECWGVALVGIEDCGYKVVLRTWATDL